MAATMWKRATACMVVLWLLGAQVGCESNPVLRLEGKEALRTGNYRLSRDKFARAVEREPTDYLAQYHLGVALLELDRHLEAQLVLERALELRPADRHLTPLILDKLAEAFYRQDRIENLHGFLAQAARDYAGSGDFLRQADYLARTGDVDGARMAYRKAAYFAQAGDAGPYLAIADFYESINDVPNAVKALRHAYFIYPDHPEIPDRFRKFGLVPGPTLRLEPPKPEDFR